MSPKYKKRVCAAKISSVMRFSCKLLKINHMISTAIYCEEAQAHFVTHTNLFFFPHLKVAEPESQEHVWWVAMMQPLILGHGRYPSGSVELITYAGAPLLNPIG